jgi:hypothetical protein
MSTKTRFFAISLAFALAFSTVGAVPVRADTPPYRRISMLPLDQLDPPGFSDARTG